MVVKEKLQQNLGLGILAFHIIGVVGTLYGPTRALTISLTPLNLTLSAGLIIVTHTNKSRSFYQFAVLSFVIGYVVEVLGVASGVIFGEYTYGPTLGWSLMGVPFVIGINWFVLSYGFAELANRTSAPPWAKVVLASVGMVGLDALIEPVAIILDYWQWAGDQIPTMNFLGWFAVSVVIQIFSQYLLSEFRNKFTIYLIISQIIYFCLILFFYKA